MRAYDAERCGDCQVHRSAWDPKLGGDLIHPLIQPVWVYCPICFLVGRQHDRCPEKDKHGNPAPGWRLVLKPREEIKGA